MDFKYTEISTLCGILATSSPVYAAVSCPACKAGCVRTLCSEAARVRQLLPAASDCWPGDLSELAYVVGDELTLCCVWQRYCTPYLDCLHHSAPYSASVSG